MSQTDAIILRSEESKTREFERRSQQEVLPHWRQFKAKGRFISGSLTPVQDGNQGRGGVRDHILHMEVPSMAEHQEFDADPLFREFLPGAQAMQVVEPLTWLGETLFRV